MEFTYEKATKKNKLETFEWDNVWFEQTELKDTKRVMYIGDSISCGIRRIATAYAENKILFDGFGTSKSLDNEFFPCLLSIALKQQGRCDAIIFNNGLHGWHLNDSEYELRYCNMIEYLKKSTTAPIYVALTTEVLNDPERSLIIKSRNRTAENIAEKFNLKTIDLYNASRAIPKLYSSDGVHLTDEGYLELAKIIVETIK